MVYSIEILHTLLYKSIVCYFDVKREGQFPVTGKFDYLHAKGTFRHHSDLRHFEVMKNRGGHDTANRDRSYGQD